MEVVSSSMLHLCGSELVRSTTLPKSCAICSSIDNLVSNWIVWIVHDGKSLVWQEVDRKSSHRAKNPQQHWRNDNDNGTEDVTKRLPNQDQF